MSRRHYLSVAAPAVAALLVLAAAVSTSCGDGNARGDCVTVYTDGDRYTYTTDKAYCEETCAQRIEDTPGIIASCYFAGSKASPLEP